ncbi:hypothetical protein K445DRAFT_13397 [Daldinia sp. EC12]|nr:hypothetical protein K445DRAFT_13397 [Daldinia sp. EC12]
MPAFDYAPVFQEGPDIGEKDALLSISRTRLSIRWRRVFFILSAAFMVSLCANVFFAYRQLFKPWELLDELPTQFAGLRRNIPTEILSSSNFDSLNRTVQDAAWSDPDMEPWNGFLALDEEYYIAQGLPHSQR